MMSEFRVPRIAGSAAIALMAALGFMLSPDQKAEALGIGIGVGADVSVNIDQTVTVAEVVLQNPDAADTDLVKVSGTLKVHGQTSVNENGAAVNLQVRKQGFSIVNLSDNKPYNVTGNANARATINGPLPAMGTAEGNLVVFAPDGDRFTAKIFFDVSVDTNGATVVSVNHVELAP
jgi:hypothetical protein